MFLKGDGERAGGGGSVSSYCSSFHQLKEHFKPITRDSASLAIGTALYKLNRNEKTIFLLIIRIVRATLKFHVSTTTSNLQFIYCIYGCLKGSPYKTNCFRKNILNRNDGKPLFLEFFSP